MQHPLLVYVDDKLLGELPRDAFDAEMKQCLRHADEMQGDGKLVSFRQFEAPAAARSVRVRASKTNALDGLANARAQRRSVADQLREKFPKLVALMKEAGNDMLAFMTFPRAHWMQIYSTNLLERLNTMAAVTRGPNLTVSTRSEAGTRPEPAKVSSWPAT